MDANVSALGPQAKRKAIVARTLKWWDEPPPRARLARGARARRPIPIASGSPKCCCSRRRPRRRRPIIRPSSRNGRGSRIWPPPPRGGGQRLRRPRLLFARAKPARLRERNRSARRAISERGGRIARPARASAPIPRRRSRRSPLDARPCRSTAISPAFSRGCSRWKSRSLRRGAKSRRRRGRSRRCAGPGDFAQALMDIGATICRPRNPDCPSCPLAQDCAAFANRGPPRPTRVAARQRPSLAAQGAVFFARRSDGAFLARRRPPHGLLASTVELPGTPWTGEGPDEEFVRRRSGRRALAAAARDGRAGLHPLRARVDGLRRGVRRRRSGGAFLGRARRGRRGGVFEHDAQGGRARLQAGMKSLARILWKAQGIAASLLGRSGRDGASSWRVNPVHVHGALIAPAAFRLPPDEVLRARFGHVTTWVFDLDNTLYPPDSGIWPKIDERITLFLIELFGIDGQSARALHKHYYSRHGTTLAGLVEEQHRLRRSGISSSSMTSTARRSSPTRSSRARSSGCPGAN